MSRLSMILGLPQSCGSSKRPRRDNIRDNPRNKGRLILVMAAILTLGSAATGFAQVEFAGSVRAEPAQTAFRSDDSRRPATGSDALTATEVNLVPTVATQTEGLPAETMPPEPTDTSLGRRLFQRRCTTCHTAERALNRSKSLHDWLTTVGRMAAKQGAEIEPAEVEPIAQYLAAESTASSFDLGESLSTWSLNATISTLYRGSGDDSRLEFPGFFADAWVTAEWQANSFIRARATACTSCHGDDEFSVELVEAAATLNLSELFCWNSRLKAELTAGRIVVPFGAFSARSHPGAYRTATMPLMFNMGRRVLGPLMPPLQPVLPAPYADEGIHFHAAGSVGDWSLGMDAFAINGLQSGGGNVFQASRRYYDNNSEPATGGRVTLSNDWLTLGASVMAGNLADAGQAPIHYKMAGLDAAIHVPEQWRFQFEYAIRQEDSILGGGLDDVTYGLLFELEYFFACWPNLSLLTRYDTLEHRHTLFGDSSLRRFTWGLNLAMPGPSDLFINHEHWIDANGDVDVLGVRWVAAF